MRASNVLSQKFCRALRDPPVHGVHATNFASLPSPKHIVRIGARIRLGGLPIVMAAVAACSSNPAPRGWLAPASKAASDPYGAWIEVELGAAPPTETLRGELIAIGDDSVFVLTEEAQFHAVAQADATRARVAFYDSQWGLLALWTTLGSFATLSHGYYLGLSLPVWLIAGPVATGGQSRAPLEEVGERRRSWEEVSKYARFPQGLPPGLDRSRLRPKRRWRGRR